MKIAFVTTQTLEGSTVIGRVLPLARELAPRHEVHVVVHGLTEAAPDLPRGLHRNYCGKSVRGFLQRHYVGRDPFRRSQSGKQRLRGWRLVWRVLANAWQVAMTLRRVKPAAMVIVKPLPENVLAALLYSAPWFFRRQRRPKIVLDVDDFELAANKLASLAQRAAVHWAARRGSALADVVVAATPFLADHFEQLTGGRKRVVMIPTGISVGQLATPAGEREVGSPAALNLLYLGSVSIGSGHRVDLLPDVLAAVRQQYPLATLVIAGSGDDVAALKKSFSELHQEIAVTWRGRFTSNQVAELVASRPIILDPVDASITNRAKSSFRVALAAAAGVPVVTSDIGIRPHWLPADLHERFFAKPADSADYARKIVSLWQRPITEAERQRMREYARQFSWGQLAGQYEKLLI